MKLDENWYDGVIVSWQPTRRATVFLIHGSCALFALIVLLVSRFIPLVYIPMRPCLFLEYTGVPCLFCGYTRSFWELMQGQWLVAMHESPLTLAVWLGVVFFFAFHTTACLFGKKLRISPRLKDRIPFRRLFYIGATAVIINWLYRIAAGLH